MVRALFAEAALRIRKGGAGAGNSGWKPETKSCAGRGPAGRAGRAALEVAGNNEMGSETQAPLKASQAPRGSPVPSGPALEDGLEVRAGGPVEIPPEAPQHPHSPPTPPSESRPVTQAGTPSLPSPLPAQSVNAALSRVGLPASPQNCGIAAPVPLKHGRP